MLSFFPETRYPVVFYSKDRAIVALGLWWLIREGTDPFFLLTVNSINKPQAETRRQRTLFILSYGAKNWPGYRVRIMIPEGTEGSIWHSPKALWDAPGMPAYPSLVN